MRPLKMLTLVVCFIATIAKSQVIDPNFNSPLPLAKAEILSVRVQPDRKILLAGDFDQFGNQFKNTLIRLNADGTLDNSFNYPLAGQNSFVVSFELRSNGQIIVSDGSKIYTLESDGTIANTFAAIGEPEFVYTIKL